MRQVMPHRSNIGAQRRSCKRFLPPLRHARSKALSTDQRLRRGGDVDFGVNFINSEPYTVNEELRRGGAAEKGDS